MSIVKEPEKMQEHKISPKEYRNILDSVLLENIALNRLNTKVERGYLTNNLVIDIKESNTFTQNNNVLTILFNYRMVAKAEDAEKAGFTLTSVYEVTYNIIDGVVITKDFMKIFSDLTLGVLLWPYFRELINSTVLKMGLPALVLPMRRVY